MPLMRFTSSYVVANKGCFFEAFRLRSPLYGGVSWLAFWKGALALSVERVCASRRCFFDALST
jgi:hypothetical protein